MRGADAELCVALARQLYLPLPLVHDAKRVFDLYRAQYDGSNDEHDRARNDAAAADDGARMGLHGVRAALRAMGVDDDVSMHDVTSLVQRLQCVPDTRDERAVTAAAVTRHAGDDTTTAALSFASFLQLLQQRLCHVRALYDDGGTATARCTHNNDDNDDDAADVRAAMRLLDVDGDGVLSESDVRQYVQQQLLRQSDSADNDDDMQQQQHPDVLRVSAMHAAELRAALQECDVNGDGVVTLSDVHDILAA